MGAWPHVPEEALLVASSRNEGVPFPKAGIANQDGGSRSVAVVL